MALLVIGSPSLGKDRALQLNIAYCKHHISGFFTEREACLYFTE